MIWVLLIVLGSPFIIWFGFLFLSLWLGCWQEILEFAKHYFKK